MIATDEALIADHRGMVFGIARSLMSRGHDLDLDDLIQAGMIGLMQAAERFDDAKVAGAKFSTYARHRVKGAIINEIRQNGRPIRIPNRYHGPAGKLLTGECADAARDMRNRHFIGDSQREDTLSLAELAIDPNEPTFFDEESKAMIAIAERHDTPETTPATVDALRCTTCNRRFKNPAVKRCYYRDCPGTNAATQPKSRPGPKPRATAIAPETSPRRSPEVPASTPAADGSVDDEIRVITLFKGMTPSARQRVLAFVLSAFPA